MWSPQVEAAATAGWRVIVPDLRGYGESPLRPGIPGNTTLDIFANDLAALLDTLGIPRVVVGGLSMGGQIAMEFARLHGSRLDGLILAATFPRVDSDEIKRFRLATADRLERGGREAMATYADELLPKMLSPASLATLPHVADHVLSMMRHAPPLGAAAALRGRAERPAYEPVLASLTIPTLIVAGDADAFTTSDDVAQMRQLLPHSELVLMRGVGHLPNLERPEEFNAALTAFLTSIRPRD